MVVTPRISSLLLLLAVLVSCPANVLSGEPLSTTQPLPTIDSRTPLADLLPTPPTVSKAPVYIGDDLASVPEVKFEAPPEGLAKDPKLATSLWIKQRIHTAAAALHLNAKEEDGFLKALIRNRPDFAGMPFLMGKDCRTEGDRANVFKERVEEAQGVFRPRLFFSMRHQRAHIALVTQNLIGHDLEGQPKVISALSYTVLPEATRALARAAVFSPEEDIRTKAIEALASRPGSESTDVLVAGLRYPWPAIARNAASAIVKLKRTDLIPQLKAVLD